MLFADIPNRQLVRLLAISENLMVYKIREEGFVTDGRRHHNVGDPIYGDPTCAAIADDESWCAVAGAGVEIQLALPGQTLAAGNVGVAYGIKIPWVEALWPLGPRQIGIVTSPSTGNPERRLLYVDVDTREVCEVGHSAGE